MKKFFGLTVIGFALILTSAFTIQAIINWKIDNEKAQVKFVMQAHGQELIGNFKGVKGDVNFDAADLGGSSFKVDVDVATINTGNDKRNGHLQAASWFDAANHPAINFTSTKITATADGYQAEGNLTAKGVTKPVVLPFKFTGDNATGTFVGSFKIIRSEYGIGKADAEVGDEVTINLEVPVTKQ
ncbi:MAG: YceI family protein [Ferruginibacter sp.]|nr:YceI family protein [Ferruginibacter sp.]